MQLLAFQLVCHAHVHLHSKNQLQMFRCQCSISQSSSIQGLYRSQSFSIYNWLSIVGTTS